MKYYEYNGRPITVKELSEISGIAPATIRDRLRRGYTVDRAIHETTINESVEMFNEASQWEDWIGMSINDLYTIYWKWCVSNEYTPVQKQGFSRHLFLLNPWLKTVPTKRGDGCHRIIRPRAVNTV